MDMFEALVGPSPGPRDRQQMLAQSLRGQNTLGLLGMASGDAALASTGQTLASQTMEGAGRLRQSRDTNDWRRTQANMAGRRRVLEKALADREMKLKERALRMEEAGAGQAEQGDPLRMGERRELRELSEQDATLRGLIDIAGRADEANIKLGNPELFGTGIEIPGGRAVLNAFAGAMGGTAERFGGEAVPIQEFWGTLDRFYNLGERNALFGATLTDNELKAWKEATITPGMSNRQIQTRLDQLMDIYGQAYQRGVNDLVAAGYSPAQISEIAAPRDPLQLQLMEEALAERGMPSARRSGTGQDPFVNITVTPGQGDVPQGIEDVNISELDEFFQ